MSVGRRSEEQSGFLSGAGEGRAFWALSAEQVHLLTALLQGAAEHGSCTASQQNGGEAKQPSSKHALSFTLCKSLSSNSSIRAACRET